MLYSSEPEPWQASFPSLNYSLDSNHHLHQPLVRSRSGEASGLGENSNNINGMNDFMLHSISPIPHQNPQIGNSGIFGSGTLDKLSFADVMQFADFGPKLASLNQSKNLEDETGVDPVCFLKFPVLNDKSESQSLIGDIEDQANLLEEDGGDRDDEEARVSNNIDLVQLRDGSDPNIIDQKSATLAQAKNNKRKRPRTVKTNEEVESQRMTHIAVERNRRRQMNEHLRVLRSLMPGSYVQRVISFSFLAKFVHFIFNLRHFS